MQNFRAIFDRQTPQRDSPYDREHACQGALVGILTHPGGLEYSQSMMPRSITGLAAADRNAAISSLAFLGGGSTTAATTEATTAANTC